MIKRAQGAQFIWNEKRLQRQKHQMEWNGQTEKVAMDEASAKNGSQQPL